MHKHAGGNYEIRDEDLTEELFGKHMCHAVYPRAFGGGGGGGGGNLGT